MQRASILLASGLALATACHTGPSGEGGFDLPTGESPGDSSSDTDDSDQSTGADTETGVEPIFDVGPGDDLGSPAGPCSATGPGDVVPCDQQAPADSFEPDIQWTWDGDGEVRQVIAVPMVANLTDDDENGEIDMCDTPDIVVIAYEPGHTPISNDWGRLSVLDGATGAVHYTIEGYVASYTHPAVGDIDGDGVAEILVGRPGNDPPGAPLDFELVAYEHDGTEKWSTKTEWSINHRSIGLADLDADGDVEIYVHGEVYDHEGNRLWSAVGGSATDTAADLDDDGDLEIIRSRSAYHHDGTPYWEVPEIQIYPLDGWELANPHVADLDDDGQAEVLVAGLSGMSIVEHDGTPTLLNYVHEYVYYRPAAIHDMDGDSYPEILTSGIFGYYALTPEFDELWRHEISDSSGFAAGTAFDFLGDGSAEAMYADENQVYIFDSQGNPELTAPRRSWTQYEYPVVADVDNDGSAEIVFGSNRGYTNGDEPALQVLRDADDRWIPARRIWNQHTYHVTNVNEDGTIPQVEAQSWKQLNTFRTQAQIAGGGICEPEG